MHPFPRLEDVTRGTIAACHRCGCETCEEHARSLEGVLAEADEADKHIDAIVCRRCSTRDAAIGPTTGEVHERAVEAAMAIAMTWSYATGEFDGDSQTAAVEHFRDAWWALIKCEMHVEDTEAQPS